MGIEKCNKEKWKPWQGTWFKPEITGTLYIISPVKIAYLVFVRRLNNFSALADLVENRMLENWSHNCDIKCYLCWSEEKKKTILVYVGQNLYYISLITFSPDVFIFHRGAG